MKQASLALVLTGCGLAPGSDLLAPFPSDGIASFGEAKPVELCLGAARVVAPAVSNGAGAVCAGEDTTPRACAERDDCDGIEACVCGRCIVEACEGASCGSGRVCRHHRCTVACSTGSDCPEGEQCSAGGCARTCESHLDCHFGERCDPLGGACVAELCSAATPCGPGEVCEVEAVVGDLREPEVVEVDGDLVAFVELESSEVTGGIYRARVEGPGRLTAEPASRVLAGGAPSALVTDAGVEIYFELVQGAGVGHATSTDGGRTFAQDPEPVLVSAPAWEQGWVGSPSVVRHGGRTLLFFEGGPKAGVGLARIEGASATRVRDTPVVSAGAVEDPVFWRDVREVGAPYGLSVGGALRVYFTARGVEGRAATVAGSAVAADANDSIGAAVSLDGETFALHPTGPVLSRLTNLRTYLGEREAAVRTFEGGAEIVFVSTDASGTRASGLATAGR